MRCGFGCPSGAVGASGAACAVDTIKAGIRGNKTRFILVLSNRVLHLLRHSTPSYPLPPRKPWFYTNGPIRTRQTLRSIDVHAQPCVFSLCAHLRYPSVRRLPIPGCCVTSVLCLGACASFARAAVGQGARGAREDALAGGDQAAQDCVGHGGEMRPGGAQR